MPRFLNTEGLPVLTIAICDRCRMKRPLSSLSGDTNFPGLRVCDQGCKDNIDPYRLAARQTERINVRFPRPDVPIGVGDNFLVDTGNQDFNISTESTGDDPLGNGNVDSITLGP